MTTKEILWVDEIHLAPPKKSYDDSPVTTKKTNSFPWLQSGAGFRPSTRIILKIMPPPPNKKE